MSNLLTIQSGSYFHKGGKPFFYLAETLWSLFSSAREDQFCEYIEYRKP